ncbi:MAG: DUF2125 domain-containing protein [Marinosulfonomonas sp.]|nr:DUF2125 domain-containing protein [Marinosulfonomonas sp.]
MTNWKSIGGSAAIITLLGSTATFAEVTAAEVWQDWHDYMTSFGYEVTSKNETSGDTVTVNDMIIAMDLPEDGGTIKVSFGTLIFKGQGDGTVAVMLPETMPVGIDAGDEFSVTMNYNLSDMSMVVSGSAAEMTYTYSAAQMGISIADLMIEGDKIDDAKLDLILTNISGSTVSTTGNIRHMVQSFSADMLTYDFAIEEPGDGSFAMAVKGSIADFKGNSDSMIPNGVDFEQFAAALTAGFAVKGGLTWGAGGYEFSTTDGGGSMTGSSSSDSGSLDFGMDRDSIHYGGTAIGTKASFTSPALPFPVDISIAESVFNLLMPVNKSDAPSDFGMTIKLGDFTVSDGIWAMFDPGGILSRDPATINLDLSGKANWLVDIMDPESDDMADVEIPGQLHALTLKALQVKVAGADLTGSGAFTFNNDDLETFDGLPAPTGALDLKLTGGNGLIDNLVKMGLLPEDQAMGARMMMGLFAVVGDGDDTLTSKIEVNGDGSILANGQHLK